MAKKKILIIDGDGYLLRMYEQKLTTLGFEVICANDGDRGFFLAKDRLPDLLVSEIKLERKSGLELLKEIKNDAITREIPLVFLTTSAKRQDIKDALACGASDYLIKAHHSPTEVVDVIIQILKKN